MSRFKDPQMLLNLALSRGLLALETFSQAAASLNAEACAEDPSDRLLQELVRQGHLTEADLDSLQQDSYKDEPLGSASPLTRWEELEAAFPTWSRYRIEGFLAAGGMGRVYRAQDPELHRTVALKFLNDHGEPALKRFLSEARHQARVDHPNICPVYEVGSFCGVPFIAMRFIEGSRLDHLEPKPTLTQTVTMMQDLADGLAAAHRLGLIHRDVKPANILVTRDASGHLHPVLLDFGLARDLEGQSMTASGIRMGTLGFAAPEQFFGDGTIDRRCDLFGLGATFYHLLSGRIPFEHPTVDLLTALATRAAHPLQKHSPELPKDLVSILHHCLEVEPNRRYESARALKEDLDRFLQGKPVLAHRGNRWYRFKTLVRRHPWMTLGLAMAVAAAFLGAGLQQRSRIRQERMTQLALAFGQESARIELELRMARLQPAHDLTPLLDRIERHIKGMEARMHAAGTAARGPGNAALGRIKLALYRFQEARQHLETALNSGADTPQVHGLLGICLSWQLGEALREAALLSGGKSYKQMHAQILERYREPARRHLQQGGKEVQPYLADSLLALLDRDHARAAQLAEDAWRQQPNLYEAKQLLAEIHMDQARNQKAESRRSEAIASFKKALEHLEGAREVGRSELGIELVASNCWLSLFSMQTQNGILDTECLENGMQASRRLDALVPHQAHGRFFRGALKHFEAQFKYLKGIAFNGEPEESVRWMEEAASRGTFGVREDVLYAGSHSMAGCVRPQPWDSIAAHFNKAISILEASAARNPNYARVINNLGVDYHRFAQAHLEHGKPYLTWIQKAEQTYRRCIRLHPELSLYQYNLGALYDDWVLAQHAFGQGPRPGEETMLRCFEDALHLNPDLTISHWGKAHLLGLLAEDRLDQGHTVADAVESIRHCAERLLRTKPLKAEGHSAFSWAHLLEARQALLLGMNPERSFMAARRSVETHLQLEPTSEFALEMRCRLLIQELAWRARRQSILPNLLREVRAVLETAERSGLNRSQVADWNLQATHAELLAARLAAVKPAAPADLMAQLQERAPEPNSWPRTTMRHELFKALVQFRMTPNDHTRAAATGVLKKIDALWPDSQEFRQLVSGIAPELILERHP